MTSDSEPIILPFPKERAEIAHIYSEPKGFPRIALRIAPKADSINVEILFFFQRTEDARQNYRHADNFFLGLPTA